MHPHVHDPRGHRGDTRYIEGARRSKQEAMVEQ